MRFRRALNICQSILLALLLVAASSPGRVLSMEADQKALYKLGISAFDIRLACSVDVGQPVSATANQEANARAVIGIAKTLALDQQGALIGLMTALTESSLQNYANDGTYVQKSNEERPGEQLYVSSQLSSISQSLPHDIVGNDHDSVGIMQQRVTGGWAQMGSGRDNLNNPEVIKRLMTPAFAAEAFFKVLIGVPNWNTIDPGVAAQTVQVSAFPTRYNDHRPQAQSLLDKLWESSPAVELPFPIEGGVETAAANSGICPAAGKGAILNTIQRFAWPNYRPPDGSRGNPIEKKPDYQEAVNRSPYKGSCDGVDCGAFVTIVMHESGADPGYNPANCNTECQIAYLRDATLAGKYTRVTDKGLLQPGDIAIKSHPPEGHTFFYVGTAISDIDPNWTGGESASASQCDRAPMASGTDTFEDYEWYHLN